MQAPLRRLPTDPGSRRQVGTSAVGSSDRDRGVHQHQHQHQQSSRSCRRATSASLGLRNARLSPRLSVSLVRRPTPSTPRSTHALKDHRGQPEGTRSVRFKRHEKNYKRKHDGGADRLRAGVGAEAFRVGVIIGKGALASGFVLVWSRKVVKTKFFGLNFHLLSFLKSFWQ